MNDPSIKLKMDKLDIQTEAQLKNFFFTHMFEAIKTVSTKPVAMYSNPGNYDVQWPSDVILVYTGMMGQDFFDFLDTYPNNKHIFSHLDQFQLSEGLMNKYGSFPEG